MTKEELIDILVERGFEVCLSHSDLPIRICLGTCLDLGMGLNGVVKFKFSGAGSGIGSTVPSVLSIQLENLMANLSIPFMKSIENELVNGLDCLRQQIRNRPSEFGKSYTIALSKASVHLGQLTFNRFVLSEASLDRYYTLIPEETVHGRSSLYIREKIILKHCFNEYMLEKLINCNDDYDIEVGNDCIILRIKDKNK